MDNFVIGTIQENIKTLSHSLQLLSSDAPTKISDLSDVSSTTPADGDTLVYNATDDIFEPRAQSGGGTTGSLSSIVPIYLDTVNNRVGIGITTPQYALDVLGDIRLQSGGTDRLIFHNTTAGEDIVSVDAIVEGNGGIWGVRTKVNGSSLSEKIRIDNVGAIGIGGAHYGTAGQVLTSNGPGSSVSWADVGAGSGGGVAVPLVMPTDATNYLLVSKNTYGTETEWLPPATAAGGVPAPVITDSSDAEFILPNSNLSNYDFRTYTLSGTDVIDSDGNVIFTSQGTGTISFTSTDGVYTSSSPEQYILKSGGLPPIPSSTFSIEFYIKFGPNPTNFHFFFQYESADTYRSVQGHVRNDGRIWFNLWNTTPGADIVRAVYFDAFDTITSINNWDTTNFNHFVFTYSGGGTEQLYLNGSLVTVKGVLSPYTYNIVYNIDETFQTLHIGGIPTGDTVNDTTKFHRLYDGILTSDQINNLYTNRDKIVGQTETGVTNYALVSKNAEGTETEWSNDFVDKTTNQYISGFKNFSNFMSIAIGSPTAQTEWPLRIGSSGPTTPGDLYFYASESMADYFGTLYGAYWGGNNAAVIGLYVDEGIRAARLYIMSDRRIKKDVVDIQDDEALNKLRVLQPKKYKYIDPNKGTQEVYGFIAQEVAEVIPYSVRLENSYLPSHMFFCKIINTNVNTSIIDTYVSHTLIVNDFLSFRDNKYNLIEGVKVIEIIDDKTIKVDRIFNKEDTVYTDTTTGETFNDVIYLYGKKIDDFHTLNKDTIWTVATAALQEVDRQLQAEKSKTSDLISRLESLEARVETLESK